MNGLAPRARAAAAALRRPGRRPANLRARAIREAEAGPPGGPAPGPPEPLARSRALVAFLAILITALAGAPGARAMPSARLAWQAPESAAAESSLLLVLQKEQDEWSLREALVVTAPAKALPHDPAAASGPLFVLEDREGRPLLAGRLRVEERRYGPVQDADGTLRCVSVPARRVSLPLRLPLAASPGRLRLLRPSSWSPASGEPLGEALGARSTDAGFEELAVFDLSGLSLEGSP